MKTIILRACLKYVASAILADGESWLPARRKGDATEEATVKSKRFALRAFFPDGKMPASTAGRDARPTFSDRLSGEFCFQFLFDGLGNFCSRSGAFLFVAPFPLRKKIVRAGQAFRLRQRINPDGEALRQFDLDFIEVIPRLDL